MNGWFFAVMFWIVALIGVFYYFLFLPYYQGSKLFAITWGLLFLALSLLMLRAFYLVQPFTICFVN